MDNRQVYRNINRLIKAIIPEYNPEKIILYGSYTKGTDHIESDIDIAIIVDGVEGSFLEKEARLYKIRRGIDSNNDKSGFLEHILSYGKVLFTK